MPEKETLERARRAKREGKRPTTVATKGTAVLRAAARKAAATRKAA